MDKFKADLHLHTDFEYESETWHGIRPDVLATTVFMSGIDVAAVTQHNRIDQQNLRFRDEVFRLNEGIRRKVTPLLGAEFTVEFRGQKCHLGYIFQRPICEFNEGNLPPVYDPVFNESTWQEYRDENPGVAIFNHPFIPTNGNPIDPKKSFELMRSGAVDGIELINGSVLDHRFRLSTIRDTLSLFRKATDHGVNLAPVGASDAHEPFIVGKVATTFPGETHQDIFDAIRNNRTKVQVVRGRFSKTIVKTMADEVGGLEDYMEF